MDSILVKSVDDVPCYMGTLFALNAVLNVESALKRIWIGFSSKRSSLTINKILDSLMEAWLCRPMIRKTTLMSC